jgi:peroxiredoxin
MSLLTGHSHERKRGNEMSTATAAGQTPAAGSENLGKTFPAILFWGGVILSIAFVFIFVAQVAWARVLITPWYLPLGGTTSALLTLFAASRQPRLWRLAIAVACVALACLEWTFVLALTVLPPYSGPVVTGGTLPAFTATLADGTPISESYFREGRPTALIFFQGRWCPFCMTQLGELEAHHAEFDRVGANVVVASLENVADAAQTQRDFPHLTVVSDEKREMSDAIDLVNRGFAPDGSDADAPTIFLLDGEGKVEWLDRPKRFIARPSASELAAQIARHAKPRQADDAAP